MLVYSFRGHFRWENVWRIFEEGFQSSSNHPLMFILCVPTLPGTMLSVRNVDKSWSTVPGLIMLLLDLFLLLRTQMPTYPDGQARKQRASFRFFSPCPFTSSLSLRSDPALLECLMYSFPLLYPKWHCLSLSSIKTFECDFLQEKLYHPVHPLY